MVTSLAPHPKMTLFMLGAFSVMALTFLMIGFYMRRRSGLQPSYYGLLFSSWAISMGGFLGAFYVLRRSRLDLLHGRTRDIVWLVLGIVWLVLSIRITQDRRSSGAVLMDVGPSPMFKLQLAFAICGVALGIGFSINPESRAQGFYYLMWGAWFYLMARCRFTVRDKGIIWPGGLLPWNRIIRCVATADNAVRLSLNKGLQRTVDLKLPEERRDELIHLVNQRMAANPGELGPPSSSS